MKRNTHNIVTASMFAALCCIATFIKINAPLKGYINLGDCVVLLSGWLLAPGYGFLAAGLGAALADIFLGYIIYAPATFAIKGIMAIIAHFCLRRRENTLSRIFGGILAETAMVLGYFVFEGFIYGFPLSVANIPLNGVQGIVGLIVGLILFKFFKRSNIF